MENRSGLWKFPYGADEANHRLFVGCRVPSKLVVLNTESGNVVAKISISGDPDDVFYDGKRHRIYAICGAGEIDIIDQADPNTYKALTKVDTANGARTGLFVPERRHFVRGCSASGFTTSGNSLLSSRITYNARRKRCLLPVLTI